MHRFIHAGKLCALALTTLIWVGCGVPAPSEQSPAADTTNNTTTITNNTNNSGVALPLQVLSDRPEQPPTTGQFTETEPNDTFEQANVLNNTGSTELNGSIAAGSDPIDMDIYRLNGGPAGTHVQASIVIRSGNDLVLGLLDDQQRLMGYADPTSTVNGPREIDLVLREATTELILVVAARSSCGSDRPYTVRFDMLPPVGVPAYEPQVIVLNFAGAQSVKIGRRAPVQVPPFTADSISSDYAGQTTNIINLVVQHVREDYAGLGVEVYASGDPNIPAGNVTTVHFGTYDASLLGLADSIDPYNTLPAQNAIIYTDTFRLFNVLHPSVDEIAQVLGNVASHESGHLLGLRHTADVLDLMDITASARQMLADQWFRNAAINPAVLPTGFQDSPALLQWAVGGTLVAPLAGKIAHRQRQAATLSDPNDFYIPRGLLGTCGAGTEHPDHDAQLEPLARTN